MDIMIHHSARDPVSAEVEENGSKVWLTIHQGKSEVILYADREHEQRLKMAADILNDAFQPAVRGVA